jgi:hypothetical protein
LVDLSFELNDIDSLAWNLQGISVRAADDEVAVITQGSAQSIDVSLQAGGRLPWKSFSPKIVD